MTNALEGDAVAKRVRELVLREYAKPTKDRLTIGVVTMNLPQQDCVMDLLEKMRLDDRRFDFAMTTLASEQNEEPLFVRNLENIQGDERDIMILSCTYGPHIIDRTLVPDVFQDRSWRWIGARKNAGKTVRIGV